MTEASTPPSTDPGHSPLAAIDHLGAQGDGVVTTAGRLRFVPFALPGEVWRVSDAAQAVTPTLVSTPSAARITPLCRHFGTCGGCVAQHMSATLYADWKRGILVEAFRQRGLEPAVAPLVTIAPRSRRRATLTARRRAGHIVLGFHERASHTLCDIEMCPVLAPAIERALPGLRAICAALLRGAAERSELRVAVTLATQGLAVAIAGLAPKPNPERQRQAATQASQAGLACLVVDGDVLLAGKATVTLASAEVELPEGAFLQAVAEAEATMVGLVLEGVGERLPKGGVIGDLFCGLGTFSFALARKARVMAFDGERAAIEALMRAAKQAKGLKGLDARRRDLYREPLSARELDAFQAVVLDPPRAGAAAQCQTLAAAKVPRVVMVSCNPATLARDLRTLVDGGYRLRTVTPIDQFLFSAHVEAVAVLER